MGSHLIDGKFQSDKYPTTPRGKVPLSVEDPTAQDLLWEYAQRRRSVDAEFSDDLEEALRRAGHSAPSGRSAASAGEAAASPTLPAESREELVVIINTWRNLGMRWTTELANAARHALSILDRDDQAALTMVEYRMLRTAADFMSLGDGSSLGRALQDLLAAVDARRP